MGSGVTGLLFEPYTGGGYGGVYSTNVTPGTTNFAFVTNGVTSVLNGTTQSLLDVGGVTVVNATSTGAAVNGTLSATGQITSSVATGTAPLSVASTTNVANLRKYVLDKRMFRPILKI